jgi:hypothetical protein
MGAGLTKMGWSTIGRYAGGGLGLALAASVLTFGGAPVLAQNKELSDRSVQWLMTYAWELTPEKFTPPDGKTIVTDKTKPKDAMVSLDVAREVVKVGRLSAHAQSCDLSEEVHANYMTLMRREQAKSQWTQQQLLFISQLHKTTVLLMTGRLRVVEKEGDRVVGEREVKAGKVESCTDTERDRVKAQITAYIGAAPAAKTAEPVKSGTQKK